MLIGCGKAALFEQPSPRNFGVGQIVQNLDTGRRAGWPQGALGRKIGLFGRLEREIHAGRALVGRQNGKEFSIKGWHEGLDDRDILKKRFGRERPQEDNHPGRA
jgi:hypothetical protein